MPRNTTGKPDIRDYIRTIVDFPHDGIMFRDVTTLFTDPRGFRMAIDQMLHPYAGEPIDKVVGLEARGFILGGAIAHQLSVGFIPIHKKGRYVCRLASMNNVRTGKKTAHCYGSMGNQVLRHFPTRK